MRKLLCIIISCFMIIAMFSGCGLLQKLGFQDTENDELHPVSSIVMSEEEANKLTDKVPVHLYFANEDNTKLKLQVRYIPKAEANKSVNNLASVIVNELINGPDSNSGLNATLPKEAKQVARIKIDTATGTATVDFNKAFVDKHPGGKAAEQLTIYSIVNSLTEIKEIQKVKFTIGGKVQKEFKGNFKFDAAFPRTPALISKSTAVPSSSVQTDENKSGKQGTEKQGTEKQGTEKQGTVKEKQGDGDASDPYIDSDAQILDVSDQFME